MNATLPEEPRNSSLADCLAALLAGELGYSRDHSRKLRNSLRRGVRLLYAAPNEEALQALLADIPATLDAFDAKWLRGEHIPEGAACFGSVKTYKAARRDCRQLIEIFTGTAKRREDEQALEDARHTIAAVPQGEVRDKDLLLDLKNAASLLALQSPARHLPRRFYHFIRSPANPRKDPPLPSPRSAFDEPNDR